MISATEEAAKQLLKQYERNRTAIDVNFRKLVSSIPYQSERGSHLCHPYPAKLLLHIPYFFLQNNLFSSHGDTVLDPFCGSGTVLVESLIAGRNAIGADCNALARLLSKVKTHRLRLASIKKELTELLNRFDMAAPQNAPDVVNLDYWFHPHVIKQLSLLRFAVAETKNKHLRDFFSVCFSLCVRRVSLADPRISVPVKLRLDQYPENHPMTEDVRRRLLGLRRVNIRKLFCNIVDSNSVRIDSMHKLVSGDVRASIEHTDARELNGTTPFSPIGTGSIQMVITSPPYAGAQKYVRASCLSMGWLGLCSAKDLRSHENMTIGREHYHLAEYSQQQHTGLRDADRRIAEIWEQYPLRAHIAANYLLEMKAALKEITRVIRPSGYFVLVSANNHVCGREFFTRQYLTDIATNLGLKVRLELIDDIHSRGLMTKRNKTASVITREWITVFQKEE